MTILDCWHTQLRLVAKHFPEVALRARNGTWGMIAAAQGTFVHVSATVQRRETTCPAHVVQKYRDAGYTIIHIEEPRG